MPALQWGQNRTEWKKGCREQLAVSSFYTRKSELQKWGSAARYTLPPSLSLSAGAVFLRFVCGSVFHLKILKWDQVQIYDKQKSTKKKRWFFFLKNWSESSSSATGDTKIRKKKKRPVYFWKKQIHHANVDVSMVSDVTFELIIAMKHNLRVTKRNGD